MAEEPERKPFATQIHGSYLLDARAAREGAPLLVGCHGYGENATAHFSELRRIPGAEEWVVAAAEALHRFYNSRTREVVGSWMTRELRELAIEDNVRYVRGVVEELRREHGASGPLVLAGFSQGVAMAYRAAARIPCSGLIVLAGDVPPEIAEDDAVELPPVLLGRGTADEWYTEAKMGQDLEVLAKKGVEVETSVFDAGHVWSDAFRERAGEFLARVAAHSGAGSPSA